MTPRHTVKRERSRRPRLVGVVTSLADLRRAVRMASPPDFFELRLDHLCQVLKQVEDQRAAFPAPLIVTARDPREGGANDLSVKERRHLLLRFLDGAAYVDVELRSVRAMSAVLNAARQNNVRRIISFHDFHSTPNPRRLSAKASRAQRAGADLFKVATRTDTVDQVRLLVDFTLEVKRRLPVSVMGIGRCGAASRIALARAGSSFIYAAIGRPRLRGQPTLAQVRSALAATGARII